MTNLNNSKLFAVEVPEDSSGIDIIFSNPYFHLTAKLVNKSYQFSSSSFGSSVFFNNCKGKRNYPKELKILGTYSKGVADFDVEKYLVVQNFNYYDEDGHGYPGKYYFDYVCKSYDAEDLEQSFGTLLTASKLNKEKRYLIIEKI